MLPHDWLTWRLGATEPSTDRGDASGIGYFSPAASRWLPDVATAVLGHPAWLPKITRPAQIAGRTPWGAALAAGTGDNMAAAPGLGLAPGEVTASMGTSGTAFAVSEVSAADPTATWSDPRTPPGGLPPVCTGKASLVLSSVAAVTGTDVAGLSQKVLAAPPGPQWAHAPAVLRRRADLQPAGRHPGRAHHPQCHQREPGPRRGGSGGRLGGQPAHRVRRRMQDRGPSIFGVPVEVPESQAYVALGAAGQAAWALAGTPEPPPWPRRPIQRYEGSLQPSLLERFAALRDATAIWEEGIRRDRRCIHTHTG
jgi:xylulokinase